MEWKKTADAAATWAGGVHPKTLYAAVRRGELRSLRNPNAFEQEILIA